MRWDPDQYLRFADERARPFRELLARVPAEDPRVVADLGCGPATLTRELAERWPGARVEGVDDSAEMIERARAEAGDGVELTLADVHDWTPAEPVDVIVSNATLQWVPGHLGLLDRLAGFLAPGGWLAVQVPGNFGGPSHTELRALAAAEPWRDRLAGVRWPAVEEPSTYLTRLAGLGLDADVWETTYYQVLPGEDAVLEWMRGTGLRPVLWALPEADERAAFEAEYRARLRRAYPRHDHGTVLPYRRIFLVATFGQGRSRSTSAATASTNASSPGRPTS
jgi:trans-aconitate 2-methyltransferase